MYIYISTRMYVQCSAGAKERDNCREITNVNNSIEILNVGEYPSIFIFAV